MFDTLFNLKRIQFTSILLLFAFHFTTIISKENIIFSNDNHLIVITSKGISTEKSLQSSIYQIDFNTSLPFDPIPKSIKFLGNTSKLASNLQPIKADSKESIFFYDQSNTQLLEYYLRKDQLIKYSFQGLKNVSAFQANKDQALTGSTIISANNSFYLYGGQFENTHRFLNVVVQLDLNQNQAQSEEEMKTQLQAQALPSPYLGRKNHIAFYYGNSIYVLGGYDDLGRLVSAEFLTKFNLQTYQSETLNLSGSFGAISFSHNLAIWDPKSACLYILIKSMKSKVQLFRLDMPKLQWTVHDTEFELTEDNRLILINNILYLFDKDLVTQALDLSTMKKLDLKNWNLIKMIKEKEKQFEGESQTKPRLRSSKPDKEKIETSSNNTRSESTSEYNPFLTILLSTLSGLIVLFLVLGFLIYYFLISPKFVSTQNSNPTNISSPASPYNATQLSTFSEILQREGIHTTTSPFSDMTTSDSALLTSTSSNLQPSKKFGINTALQMDSLSRIPLPTSFDIAANTQLNYDQMMDYYYGADSDLEQSPSKKDSFSKFPSNEIGFKDNSKILEHKALDDSFYGQSNIQFQNSIDLGSYPAHPEFKP